MSICLSVCPVRTEATCPSVQSVCLSRCQVSGVDAEGYAFQRTTPTALSSVSPDSPQVRMDPVARGYYRQTVNLTCHVTSLIPYTVQWHRNGAPLGNRLFYRCV